MMDYTNDLNPEYPKDQAVMIACMMAQDQLKRDLKKYELKVESIKRARELKETNNTNNEINMKSSRNHTEISSVNVNDNVNVNVNVLDKSNIKEKDIKEKSPTSRFIPPTLEEVKAYCDERRNKVNPEDFINFYQSKGWYVGKNKMKDWKAAVRTWEKDAGFKTEEEDNPNGGFRQL
jgi:DNA-directed RNA polymerase subunit K/omega